MIETYFIVYQTKNGLFGNKYCEVDRKIHTKGLCKNLIKMMEKDISETLNKICVITNIIKIENE